MRLADPDFGTPDRGGETVHLRINGQSVEAKSGDSIMRAALTAGIHPQALRHGLTRCLWLLSVVFG
jgi:hypothetical protein